MRLVHRDPVVEQGMEIFRLMEDRPPAIFDRKLWIGKVMSLAMENPAFRLALFRFIDVLPTLTTSQQLSRHTREYFLEGDLKLPCLTQSLLALSTSSRFSTDLLGRLVEFNISRFAKNFIAGASPAEAIGALKQIWGDGETFSVDLLGESAISEIEADRYQTRYLHLADTLAQAIAEWPVQDLERELFFPRLSLSIKISALYSRIGPANHDDSVEQIKLRLRPILFKLKELNGQAFIDMETFSLKELTLDVFTSLLDEPEFRDWRHAGIALQAYLRTAERDLRRLIEWTKQRDRHIHIRLVKGAYWEYERTVASQRNWPVPVFTQKSHTDACFERCVEIALSNPQHVSLAIASHNVRSIAAALVTARRLGVPPERFQFQMLFGMAEPIKQVLKTLGHPVRAYAPVGELVPGMAYLVRRLLENTSNEGFLRKTFIGQASAEELLTPPISSMDTADHARVPTSTDFLNEPPLDFAEASTRAAFVGALAGVRRQMGQDLPLVYGGKQRRGDDRLVSLNPASPNQTVCTTAVLTRAMADEAFAAAKRAQICWGETLTERRSAMLFRAGEIARQRRFELAAWEVIEVGKNWVEADADVCEAIDFLEYYGREMMRLSTPRKLGNALGENNRYFYQARGVGLIVAPWNFPLAISMGMVAAALVTGNAVLYKPSSQSLRIGWLIHEIFQQAGTPAGVLNFVPGRGAEVGDYLVEHPDADFIAFTGSLEVGLGILEKAGRTRIGQKGPKKVVIETGGKNAIIIDDDADLDQAIPGVIQSAFGFQGQKCSACSRVIVMEGIYVRFVERLAEAVKGIAIGNPEDPKFFMGPVIDESAQKNIRSYIQTGKREGRLLAEVTAPNTGYYVPPSVFVDLPPTSKLIQDEIFGPVLAIIRTKTLDEAIQIANSSIYALTGGIYSRSPANIDKATRHFSTGNLYVNRPITGALVARQPFGGFKMSGVGSKAGGPEYLQQFMEPRVITENTMRRGFTPEDV